MIERTSGKTATYERLSEGVGSNPLNPPNRKAGEANGIRTSFGIWSRLGQSMKIRHSY